MVHGGNEAHFALDFALGVGVRTPARVLASLIQVPELLTALVVEYLEGAYTRGFGQIHAGGLYPRYACHTGGEGDPRL
jgi:hypothetical protein